MLLCGRCPRHQSVARINSKLTFASDFNQPLQVGIISFHQPLSNQPLEVSGILSSVTPLKFQPLLTKHYAYTLIDTCSLTCDHMEKLKQSNDSAIKTKYFDRFSPSWPNNDATTENKLAKRSHNWKLIDQTTVNHWK